MSERPLTVAQIEAVLGRAVVVLTGDRYRLTAVTPTEGGAVEVSGLDDDGDPFALELDALAARRLCAAVRVCGAVAVEVEA